ncbi:thioesterase [Leptospira adleri]|uniref:Thioesterase n=1 Tax=Leptospira adleri TaxID=2023186 RepID=A0A2M9YTH5_9LEPT|nr:thioesterase [Leptospira adleri]PJZ54816.1 thioesterase [Leptospira adleri]PJZ59998.1 thioesterase [Leptospira adleri]TGM57880.1 acyl-CoA thioesterase [Leptospira adleri]
MTKTKTHEYETFLPSPQFDGNGNLTFEKLQTILNEARKEALQEIELYRFSSGANSIEPLILWSESDFKEIPYFSDSVLIQTELQNLTGPRYKISQRLLRKSDYRVICRSNSLCILFDSHKKRPWKKRESLLAG